MYRDRGAVIGFVSRGRLPEHHLSRESGDVIKLSMGLLATLVAVELNNPFEGLLQLSSTPAHNLLETLGR